MVGMNTKTRILEYMDGNGKTHFRCQYKWWWFWLNYQVYSHGEAIGAIEFNNYEDARKYIEEELYRDNSRKRWFRRIRKVEK